MGPFFVAAAEPARLTDVRACVCVFMYVSRSTLSHRAMDVGSSVAAFASGVPKLGAAVGLVVRSAMLSLVTPSVTSCAGVGSLLGAGIFITTLCLATVALVADVEVNRAEFLRDVWFFFFSVFYLLVATLDGVSTPGFSLPRHTVTFMFALLFPLPPDHHVLGSSWVFGHLHPVCRVRHCVLAVLFARSASVVVRAVIDACVSLISPPVYRTVPVGLGVVLGEGNSHVQPHPRRAGVPRFVATTRALDECSRIGLRTSVWGQRTAHTSGCSHHRRPVSALRRACMFCVPTARSHLFLSPAPFAH